MHPSDKESYGHHQKALKVGCFKLTLENFMVLPKVDHSPSLPGVSIIVFMEDQKQLIRGFRYLIKSCLTPQFWSRE